MVLLAGASDTHMIASITVALTLHLTRSSSVASITMETKGISHKLPMTFRGEFNISTHKSSFNLMIQSILNPYSTFNAYSIFNALFNIIFQWTMFNAYSKFSKPFNVQWEIQCNFNAYSILKEPFNTQYMFNRHLHRGSANEKFSTHMPFYK